MRRREGEVVWRREKAGRRGRRRGMEKREGEEKGEAEGGTLVVAWTDT